MPHTKNVIFAKSKFEESMVRGRRASHVGKGRKNLVILCTTDPDGAKQNWFLVPPENVPEALKDPEVMGNMEQGRLAQPPGSELFYRAEPSISFEKKLQRTLAAQKHIDAS